MILFYLAGFFILALLALIPVAKLCDALDWDSAALCCEVGVLLCLTLSPLCGMAGFVYLIVKAV